MTKQVNIELATAIGKATANADGFILASANGASVKVRAKRAFEVAAALTKMRTASKGASRIAEKRAYPKFKEGMSTAQYVAQYQIANRKFNLSDNWDAETLNRAPCALYENGAFDFFPVDEANTEEEQHSSTAAALASGEAQSPTAPEHGPVNEVAAAPAAIREIGAGVRRLSADQYDALHTEARGRNLHSETLMLMCFRAGRDDLAWIIVHLVRQQQRPDCMGIGCAEVQARAAVAQMLRGASVLDACTEAGEDAVALLVAWGMNVPDVTPPVVQKAGLQTPTVATPGALAQLMAQAREARRIMRAAIAKARESSAAAIEPSETARMLAEFPDLEPVDGRRGGVEAAKNVRRVLKRRFPGVGFSVKSDYNSLRIKWEDGPTDEAVTEAVAPFDIGRSDTQSDYFYTEDSEFSRIYGGVQYLFTNRALSDALISEALTSLFGSDGPTVENFRRGTAWSVCGTSSQVYWDEWAWLAEVRRAANKLTA